jgi:hypothetical protein
MPREACLRSVSGIQITDWHITLIGCWIPANNMRE